jgi:hypothetical protein
MTYLSFAPAATFASSIYVDASALTGSLKWMSAVVASTANGCRISLDRSRRCWYNMLQHVWTDV